VSPRKTKIRCDSCHEVMTVVRAAFKSERMVYVLKADESRSRIIYIGETGRGRGTISRQSSFRLCWASGGALWLLCNTASSPA
jgi:hypothetical protein